MRQSSTLIDLCRWLSAWVVALCHIQDHVFLSRGQMTGSGPIADAFVFLVGSANIAVLVFFVLSGYLVGGALLARFQTGRVEISKYASDRLTRLYVVLVPGLLVAFAAAWLQSKALGDATALSADENSLATLLGNLAFLQTIVVPSYGGDYPLWSLAYEFWYYVAFPLCLLAWMGRTVGARITSTVLLLGLAVAASSDIAPLQIASRFPIWLFGVVVATRLLPALPLAVTIPSFLVAATLSRLSFRGLLWSDLLVGATVALLLQSFLVREQARPLASTVWSRLNAHIASWSYSLYVVHVPIVVSICVLCFGRRHLDLALSGAMPIATYVGISAVTLLLSWAFAAVTERHTERVRLWLRTRRWPKSTASAADGVAVERQHDC